MNKTFKTKQYKNLNFQLLALPDTNYFKIEVVNKLGADAERTYLKKTGENIFGLSHLVEHLSFKTSKDYSTEELLKLLKSEGIFNASTDFDRINYFFETSMDKLNLGTKLIFNCALNTLLKVSQEDFETEKLVVTNEIKRYFDDDQTMFHLSIPSSLLDLDKNDNILGSPETIKEVTLKQSQSLKSFFLNEGENFFNITYDPTILTELEVLEAVYSEYIKFEKQPSAEYPITAIEVKEDLKQPIKNNRIKLDSEAEQSLTYFNFDIFKNSFVSVVGNLYIRELSKTSLNDLIREQNGLTYGVHLDEDRMAGNHYIDFFCDVSKGTEDKLFELFNESITESSKNFTEELYFTLMKSEKVKRNLSFMNLKAHNGWFWDQLWLPEELTDFKDLLEEDIIKVYDKIDEEIVTFSAVKAYLDSFAEKVNNKDFKVITSY